MRAAVNPNKRQIESNKPKQVHRFKKAKITSERSTVRSTEETKSQHNSREGSKSTVLSGPRIGKGRVVHAGQHYLTIQNSPASCRYGYGNEQTNWIVLLLCLLLLCSTIQCEILPILWWKPPVSSREDV